MIFPSQLLGAASTAPHQIRRIVTTLPREWIASFISASEREQEGDPATYFRRGFTVASGVQRATLFVTGLGIVEPYVNGERVGDVVLAPGWTSYKHRLMVSAHDVAHLLIEGENAIGAIVGEGWAVGTLGGDGHRHFYADRPVLFAELHIEYADRVEVIGTDEQFQVGTGAVRGNGIYAGETFDARLEAVGWSEPGFDATQWSSASIFEWSTSALEAPTAPPIRRIEEITPVEILETPSGRTVIDFGQNIAGWVQLRVEGNAGTTIVLRHAEHLGPDGEADFEPNRSAAATDRYILRGGGVEVWEPRFTFHGFRYVDIEGWPGAVSTDAIRAIVVHSDMARTGWLDTSDPLLNRLHSNTVWSMRDNFVGVPTDCPQRDERLGWTGDLNAFSPVAVFLYDVKDMLGSWLQDLAAEQRELGLVPSIVPAVGLQVPTPTALWSDVAVSLPWLLYQEYGDVELLRASYSSMATFMRQVEAQLDENGLWSSGVQYGDWLDPDAPADHPADGKTPSHLVAAAYLCKTTRELAEAARVLGESADAAHFGSVAERVRSAFRREYVTPAGRVASESATAYALAIMFGIVEGEQRIKAGQQLAELVRKAHYTISTGFAGTPLVTEALSSTGHLEDAYALLLQKRAPSFLYPVTLGATTIWERWDAVLPDGTLNSTGMTSLNHYAFGAVADWMHRVIGGLQRTAPGWRTFRVAPQVGGGLTHATAIHDTPRGRASVDWRIKEGTMTVRVIVPEGSEALVELPLHPDQRVDTVGIGEHDWTYVAAASSPPLTLDSTFREVMRNEAVWAEVLRVLQAHYPGLPIEHGIEHALDTPLASSFAESPERPETLIREIEAALRG